MVPALLTTRHFSRRFLGHQVQTRLLNAAHVPPLLRTIRRTLFPNNTFRPSAPPLPPTPSERHAIKLRCATAILDAMPPLLRSTYLSEGRREAQMREIEGWLDVLGDAYLNKHLVFAVLELLVVRVMPELAEMGPGELLAERAGVLAL
jgi:hypothetical protein